MAELKELHILAERLSQYEEENRGFDYSGAAEALLRNIQTYRKLYNSFN